VLGAAVCWAGGNTVQRAVKPDRVLGFVVWSSLFAAPPLVGLAIAVDGWPAVVTGVTQATPATWAAVAYQSVGNTLIGYGVWAWLLGRYPAATISPLSLLVPLVGMASSALLLGEPLQDWKLAAAGLVLSGLALNTLWPMWRGRGPA